MVELALSEIKKYMDATLVLKNITFEVYDGEKVGVVGANGSGKSTILKLIAGVETLNRDDNGWIALTKGATVSYLEQVPSYPEGMSVNDVLMLAFEELHSIEGEMRKLEDRMKSLKGMALEKALKQYSDMQHSLEAKGGYDIEEKLSKVCKGLKLDEEFLNRSFDVLSGGEKTTVLLGKILLEDSDLLLLDEPTNHLDMDSIEWLENYLKNYKGIVVIVSHDRYFLDNVVTKIIEVEDMECETYKGNYSEYVKEKEERMLIEFNSFKEQQKQISAMEKAVKDLRDWGIRADNNKFFKRAASIQKKLDKMERLDKPAFEKKNMKLNFNQTERSGNEVIKAEDISKSFGDKIIFKDANLMVNYRERVALIGSNGSGKSTFIKMLLGDETGFEGTVELGANVKAAYLPQNIVFENEEATVLECFREDISILEGRGREYLSKFMFFGSSVFKKVKNLSGGEKIRLKLSKLLYEDINLLILDEPTNHLDIESIETLEEALGEFKGTIFFVSHDRYFINRMGERIFAIENNAFKNYLGNYDYYKTKKSEQNFENINKPSEKKEKPKKVKVIDENKRRETEIAKLEERISTLENEIKEIDALMIEMKSDYEGLNRLYTSKEEIKKLLDEVMEAWVCYNE